MASIINQINNIVKTYNETVFQYGAKAPPLSETQGERLALCNEAYDIILRAGGTPDQKNSIAVSFVLAGDTQKAKDIAQQVIDEYKDGGAVVVALRVIGTIEFQSGDIEAGRRTYERALRVFDEIPFSNAPTLYKVGYNSFTEIDLGES
ncbi:MAG: hypothetical protein ACRDST_04435 [Pseudonocardiaceae bacterium]